MAIASHLSRFLHANGIHYTEYPHLPTLTLEQAALQAQVPTHEFVRAVLLSDGAYHVLAVLPLKAVLNLEQLNAVTGHQLLPVSRAEASQRFHDCAAGCHPPLGEPYGLKTVIDAQIAELDTVYFEAGSHDCVLGMSRRDFLQSSGRAQLAAITVATVTVAQKPAASEPVAGQGEQVPLSMALPGAEAVQQRLQQLHRLPAIPAVATQILQMVADPDATAKDLAALVEMDPSIAAQIIRYARSSFFAYRGNIDSIQNAITRVLGFDIVSNLALGIAAGKAFKLSAEGPLGLDAFWRHAVHNAALVQILTKAAARERAIKPGTAYLCGLLHNFGVLLLGHLFPTEYYQLNRLAKAYPGEALPAIEQRLAALDPEQHEYSLSHHQLGAWLMRYWKMPPEVILVTEQHHNVDYAGEGEAYVALVQIANTLLARDGIGDGTDAPLDDAALARAGLSAGLAEQAWTQLRSGAEELDRMASIMASGRTS